MYNDKSVLENMHASVGMEYILGKHKKTTTTTATPNTDTSMDILKGMTSDQITIIRNTIISVVLQTDMTFHFEKMNHVKGMIRNQQQQQMKNIISSNSNSNGDNGSSSQPQQQQQQPQQLCSLKGDTILGFLLHAADISNGAKSDPMFVQ